MRSPLAFLVLVSTLFALSSGYTYIHGPVHRNTTAPCPGRYCGRSPIPQNDSYMSECGKCQRGWKVNNNSHSLCEQCTDRPEVYDWLFLAFHVIFVLVLHWVAIDLSAKRRNFTKEVLLLHVCALVEVISAALITLVINEPFGEMDLVACRVKYLSDWYSFLHNPNPNYEETLYCTQEVVYPLYTMIFTFYAFCVLIMILLRPFFASKMLPRRGRSSIYAALYFLPILAVIHGTCGGLVYMSYPYVVLVLSLISSATHFALKLNQSAKALFLGCFTDARNFVILMGHWLLHAFGIVAITQLKNLTLHLSLMALVPFPALFYIATARFTNPIL